jgi:hypothetical protein
MSKKHHGGPAPIPAGNRTTHGLETGTDVEVPLPDSDVEAGFHDQDPKRRLGKFGGAGEHPRQQPTALNDGNRHSK